MKKFKPKLLQPGDILLFRTTKNSPLHDKLISLAETLIGEKMTKYSYHHVAMVGNNGNVYEAIWNGTICHPYAEVDQTGVMEVYRVKNVTKDQVNKAIIWADENLGERYDFVQLFFGWAGLQERHAQICCTYVGNAWQAAGIQLTPKVDEKIYSPDDIAVNKKILKRVF